MRLYPQKVQDQYCFTNGFTCEFVKTQLSKEIFNSYKKEKKKAIVT